MTEHFHALILEDRPADAELVVAELRRQAIHLDWDRVETEEEFLGALRPEYDVILSDFSLPGFDALAALRHVQERGLDVPVIIVTGAVGEETAAECIREGASDYLLKDRLGRLGLAVREAVRRRRLEEDRHRIESALAASQTELVTVFESAPVPMLIVDGSLKVVRVNREALAVARRTRGDVFGRRLGEALCCSELCGNEAGAGGQCTRECGLRNAIRETLDSGASVHGRECALDLGDAGNARHSDWLVSVSPLAAGDERLAVVALNEITERKRAEERERKLNRLLATVRNINQLIVRETRRDWLLAETCRIAVEVGAFAMAWVGEIDPEMGGIRPVAVAGRNEGYLAEVGLGWERSAPGRGPVGVALGIGEPVVVHDIESDPRMLPWREAAAARGYRGEAVLPLRVRGRVSGVLVVYVDQTAAFDDDIVALLQEMSEDLGFALGALEIADEHAKAEEALRENEERYRQLFEAESDAILLIDNATGRILEANSAAEAMYGYTREELLRLRNTDLSAEPEATRQITAETQPDRERVVVIPHRLHRRRDGAVMPVEITGRFFEWKGRPVHVAAIRDVSERHRILEALRESEERYRTLVDGSPIGIYRTSPGGRLLAANPALVEMLGYESFEEMEAFDVAMDGYTDPADREAFVQELDAEGEVVGREVRLRRRDGTTLWARESARAVWAADGGTVYYEGTLEDISETRRVQAERDLIFTLAIDLFCVAGFDGYFKQLNPAWEATLGWTVDELEGRPFIELVHPDDRDATRDAVQVLLEGRQLLYFENRYACRDGSYRWLSWNSHPLLDEGLIFAVARDVTASKELEEQLIQAQKMEAVGRLAGGVAHDFNNLLQALLSQAQLVRAFSSSPDRLDKVAADLEQQVLRGAALTRQLLLFSRREAPTRRALDLNRVIEGQAQLLRRLVRENIAFETDLADTVLPVLADHGQLEQVLMNLVVNASDVLEDGGVVTIRSGGDADAAWLAVEDDGPGIPDPVRDRIFEPFFTTKAAAKGTGLGLSVVHGIVTQHGGRIDVEDRQGGGTIFRVSLPRAEGLPDKESSGDEKPAVQTGHGERILVVEDEASAREALAELLAALGYEPTAVASAEETSHLPADAAFDVLITDLMLPGKPGNELARDLESRWPGVAVVLMSGYTEDEVVRRGAVDGSVRFLQKPFDMKTLAATVAEALGAPAES